MTSALIKETMENDYASALTGKENHADASGFSLIERLMDIRNECVGLEKEEKNTNCRLISRDNIRRAKFHLENMNRAMLDSNLREFNRSLVMLLSALPRPLQGMVIATQESMAQRLIWETAFTDAVEKVLIQRLNGQIKTDTLFKREAEWLRRNSITIMQADSHDEMVIRTMMKESGHRFIRAWKVCADNRNEAFDRYCRKKGITNTKMLWHGSPTVNFISILENGLSISSARFGMFGKGIYFAPSFDKSRGYCSVSGARWRGGEDKTAFLAVAEVATGNVMHTNGSAGHGRRTAPDPGYNSLWAHTGPELRSDEVIVYDSDAVRIRYIVETL